MHRTHCHPSTAKHLKGKKGFMSSFKGVSRLPLRARRRLYCRLQMWMWRRRREKCRLGMLKARKRAGGRGGVISASPCLGVKLATQLQKNQRKLPTYHTPSREHFQVKLCEPVSLSEHTSTDTNVSAGNDSQKPQDKDTLVHSSATSDPLKLPNSVKPPLSPDSGERGLITTHSKEPREPARRLEADGLSSGQLTSVSPRQGQATKGHADDHTLASKKTDVSLKQLKKDIHEFLDDFYRKYGSYIPLHNRDVWTHVKRRFNCDLSDRKDIIYLEVIKYRTAAVQKAVPPFRVVYRRHTLNMDDLSTLADQNWLNDQVINMYGDLIMESAHKKVHFLNSFFHRQLMTKGYDGVKRWTKQVDLFSKTFLLVPIHLEVHWCLVTADIVQKKICIYDSQGDPLHKLARNIVKYLMAEAKEKKQTAFENGWAVSFDKQIPQQTNENDCGVFVLEYCRCLALAKPLRFTQKDIPKIRKRIYKELCDCKLHEQG